MSTAQTPASAAEIPRAITSKGAVGLQARYLKDRLARYVVLVGGLGVIGALLLIFVYLAQEVAPLFQGAHVEERKTFAVPGGGKTLYLAAEEQGEVGMRAADDGEVTFFDLFTGQVVATEKLPLGERKLGSVTSLSSEHGALAAGLDDGSVLVFAHEYKVTYPNDKRLITPVVSFPRGNTPIAFSSSPVTSLAARDEGDTMMLVGADAAGALNLKVFSKETSMFGDETFTESPVVTFMPDVKPDVLLLEPALHWLYVIDREAGKIAFYKLNGAEKPALVEVEEAGAKIANARYLAGGISIVVAQADGKVTQWFPARHGEEGTWYLARVREFRVQDGAKVTAIGPEQRRRGFAVGDASGHVSLYYATSGNRVYDEKMFDGAIERIVFNPRAQVMLVQSADGKLRVSEVHNEHPEISFSALWRKVWYESYDEPAYLYQSSAASSDFEPKFSLTPLMLGTLKGAFYAMIFAIPLAVMGAIFTANFMSPEMRQIVKPSVEVLAALPSVILGFLAGLWLAPFVETNLPGMFMTLLFLPLSIPIFGYVWSRMPRAIRLRVPAGWEAALLIPVIAFVVWACFAAAKPVEALAFDGNMQSWMDHTLGIGYIQRNSLVVGIAMGIAVIPVIFSIAEDAIFSVPKHLSLGSLALGATPWQTLVGVVLPTASPGIFSAIMIGLGRAVGETMIVLMATGNTAVMDFGLFSGMRTLAANVAVEMPESEVGSTHFRLLFFAGLVLFLFTFILNTFAETVRSRLRRKYSSL
jgi:phosphate transport system permease protein